MTIASNCPYEATYDIIKGKWTVCIVSILVSSARGFNEMLRMTPELSPKVLAQKLKWLEARGIIERSVLPTTPPSSQYSLTTLGRDLMPLISAIEHWGRRYISTPEGV